MVGGMRTALLAPVALLALTSACTCPGRPRDTTEALPAPAPEPSGGGPTVPTAPPGPSAEARTPAVEGGHPLYARVEGTSFKNDCSADAQCQVGGCSGEVCTAEQGVNTTCEMPADGFPSKGASCGCVQGQCIWYKAAGAGAGAGGGGGAGGSVPQGQSCKDAACAPGLQCVKYYGVAGPTGPQFATCEVPCPDGSDAACPKGQKCTTIADGPGKVCR
jgi:eight-cysteine-cluster-containing protein